MSGTLVSQIREQVLRLHEAIVAHERIAFERMHGRQSAGAFLDILVKDPGFAWLSGFTTLIVRLDELLDPKHGEGVDDDPGRWTNALSPRPLSPHLAIAAIMMMKMPTRISTVRVCVPGGRSSGVGGSSGAGASRGWSKSSPQSGAVSRSGDPSVGSVAVRGSGAAGGSAAERSVLVGNGRFEARARVGVILREEQLLAVVEERLRRGFVGGAPLCCHGPGGEGYRDRGERPGEPTRKGPCEQTHALPSNRA